MFTAVDHIGLVVADLDAAIEFYQTAFDITEWERIELPERHAAIGVARFGDVLIELITPTSDQASFARFLRERGPGMHHIAYRVDDINAALATLQARGIPLIDREPRPGIHDTLVAFVHPKAGGQGVLVELVQHRSAHHQRAALSPSYHCTPVCMTIGAEGMTTNDAEDRRLLVSMSVGQTAYAVWAKQARRERFFNIARLLEASAAVKRVRAEQAMRRLGEVGQTATNINRALAGLEPEAVATGPVTGTSAFQRELLERAARALAVGRDLTYTELGDLFVCSTCGRLMEGEPPAFCPECGTVREGFLEFRIVDGMGTLGPHAIVRRLEQGLKTVQALVAGLTEEQLATPVNGLPAFKDLIGHLTDMDIVFRERAWMILETNQPKLSSAHPPTLRNAVKYRSVPIDELIEQYTTSRQQTLSLLRGLTQAAWQRIGHHEIYGPVPLLHQGNWVVAHEQGHLIELAQMRHNLLHGQNRAIDVAQEILHP